MSKLSLTFASGLYDRTLALYTGEVKPSGIDLTFVPIDEPRHIFDRMSRDAEFDVAEYSLSEFVHRFGRGECPFVAVPAFPSRAFRHGFIAVRASSGIKKPADLSGRRIGVPLYTMTAAIFIRGMLRHEYGVDLSNVQWVQAAMNTPGAHGDPTVLPLLKPASIVQDQSVSSLAQLLERGVIDATIGSSLPDSVRQEGDVVRLFPDFVDIEKEYFRRTGIFPIMHLVAIRRDLYERHPFVAASMYRALCAAKEVAMKRMINLRALRYMTPWLMRDIEEARDNLGEDWWPYGVEVNRPTLEAVVQYLVEQHLISDVIPVDDLFVPIRD